MNVDWTLFFGKLVATYQPYALTLVGLILLDVLLGVASGLKAGVFQWRCLAEFYVKAVVPGLLGWIGFTVATYLVMPDLLGTAKETVSQATCTLAWATVVAQLGSSIIKSAREVYAMTLGAKPKSP